MTKGYFQDKLKNLNKAFKEVAKEWSNQEGRCRILEENYPFNSSFDELASDVSLWVNEAIDNTNKVFIWVDGDGRRFNIDAYYFLQSEEEGAEEDHTKLVSLYIGDRMTPESESNCKITRIK